MKLVEGRVRIEAGEETEVAGVGDSEPCQEREDAEERRATGTTNDAAGRNADGPAPEEADGTFASLDAFLAALDEIGATHGATIQAFDARYVAGEAHLRAAVEHAERALERGENVADSPAVEILCYAAGRRQIDRAMEMGVSAGVQDVVIAISGGDEAAAAGAVRRRIPAADVEPDPATIEAFFEIPEGERRATAADLETLVCERVALLDVEK